MADADHIPSQQRDPGTQLPPAPLPHVSPRAEPKPKRVLGGNGGELQRGGFDKQIPPPSSPSPQPFVAGGGCGGPAAPVPTPPQKAGAGI